MDRLKNGLLLLGINTKGFQGLSGAAVGADEGFVVQAGKSRGFPVFGPTAGANGKSAF